MKIRTLAFLLASAAGCWLQPAAAAFVDPAQIQTEAYVNLVQADQSLDAGRLDEALSQYQTARDYYLQLARDYPGWEPRIIQYRKTYCDNQIADIERQQAQATAPAELPVAYTPPPPPAPAPTTPPPAPAPDTQSVQINYLQSRIASLETELAKFAALQETANALTQANEQLQRDLAQAHQQMAAQSVGGQEELHRLQEELAGKDQRIQALERDLGSQAQLRQALNDMEAQVHELRAQQERLNTEMNALDAELDQAETRAEAAEQKAIAAEQALHAATAQIQKQETPLGGTTADVAQAAQEASARRPPKKQKVPAKTKESAPVEQAVTEAPVASAAARLPQEAVWATAAPRPIPDGMSAADFVRELLQRGENEAALATIQEARGGVPNDVNLALIEGIALIRLQHYPQAAAMLIELAKDNPRNAEINATLGAAMMGAGFYEEAREALMLAIKLDRNVGGEYYYNLALLNAFADPINLKTARRYYQQARNMGVAADSKLEEAFK